MYSIFSDKEWLFDDSKSDKKNINLVCAGNSFACFQMIIEADEAEISVNGDIDFEIFKLVPTCVNRNSVFLETLDYKRTPLEELPKYHTRKAPFNVYDAMIPLNGNKVSNESRLYLYFKGKTSDAGTKCGNISIKLNGETLEIPYSVKVLDVKVPDERTFNMINWVSFNCNKYGCERFDEKFWQVVRKTIALTEISRQNYVNVTLTFITRNSDGIFDFSNLKKYIDICFSHKYTKIEGPALSGVYTKFFADENPDIPFYDDRCIEKVIPFLKAWYNFLKENNWLDITVQHVFDEPRDKNKKFYDNLAKTVREYMPGIKLLDAILTLNVEEGPDILIPTTRFYQLHRDHFEKMRRDGKQLWSYTCCWPSAPYLNRFLDMPLLSVRLIHWLNFYTDCPGYLHWALCFFKDGVDQFKTPSITLQIFDDTPTSYMPPGDSNITYEYEGEPVGSVRLEMQRAGVEDFELLCMIKDKTQALSLTSQCIYEDFTGIKDISAFEKIYETLLEKAKNAR